MRITIIGLPGSGKSTLAQAIAEKLSIPHIQMDRFWFESGGRQSSRTTPNVENVRSSALLPLLRNCIAFSNSIRTKLLSCGREKK